MQARFLLLLLAASVGAVQASGRQQPPVRDARLLRSGIELTTITSTVTDKDGHLVTDLPREAFEVYEDGERQVVTQFSSERVAVGLGVLLDISDSMFGKRIRDARDAVDRFLFGLLAADDEFFITAFNHKPRPLTTWTRDPDVVRQALDSLKPSGGTAIYDAVIAAVPLVEHRNRARAAIVIISDGADTASTATLRDIRTALLSSDVLVYAIAIDSPEPQPINTRVNAQALREITAESGGRTEIVSNSTDLEQATARIADELNHQYVLGYTSSHGADGKFHSIRVRTTGAELKVRARNGYIAGR